MKTHSLSAVMSFSFSLTFTRAFITLCFAVECSVRPVLIYFRKPMLATRCVENLLKFTQVRRNYSVDIILWSPYFIADTFNIEWRSWWTKNGGVWFFWSVMTSNVSVYLVPIGNSTGLVMTLSFMVMKTEGSSNLMVIKILRCFTRRFTMFSDSELPNFTMIGVV